MSTPYLFIQGLKRGGRAGRLVAILYCITLLLALPVAYAFHTMLGTGFADSAVFMDLTGSFDFTLARDFLDQHGDAFRTVISTVAPTVLLALLVSPFLVGGTLAALRENTSAFAFRTFIRDAGYFYGRMFRLSLILISAGAVVIVGAGFVLTAVVGATLHDALSEIPAISATVGGIAAIGLFLALLLLVADYARISVIVGDTRHVLWACVRGVGFVTRNFRAVLLLALFFIASLLLITAVYSLLTDFIPHEFFLRAPILILLQQLLVIGRSFLRVASYSAEIVLFEDRKPAPMLFYGWGDSPALPRG